MITNAFSLNMLAAPCSVHIREISQEEASSEAAKRESAVGHEDTAAVFSNVLGIPVPYNRTTVSLNKGDTLLVGQYRGPRLEEGATLLPEGATIQWLLVTVE